MVPPSYRDPDEAALLQIGYRGQVELAGHHVGRSAPIRAEAARIDRTEVAEIPRRVIAGEGIAVGLAQVGVVVAEVEREDALGDAEADVPGGVALVGNASRERRAAAEATARERDLRAVERVARSKV